MNYPKITIITCVFNGEKYLSKLLESVLNMGYPNIEHIIVDDGSTDFTEKIVMEYSELYRRKKDSALYIKYIKQKNMGLGAATNAGLKHISGEYWTWINCDDWYEPEAFITPSRILMSNPQLDYIHLNGYYVENNKKSIIINNKIISKCHFNNPRRLYLNYCKGTYYKVLLFLCRTASYCRICPSMQIGYSKYAQDNQFISQIFPNLNGSFYTLPCWNFLQRPDSMLKKNRFELENTVHDAIRNSIDLLNIPRRKKDNDYNLILEKNCIRNIKISAKCKNPKLTQQHLKELTKIRRNLFLINRVFTPHFLFIYHIYSLINFYKKRI